MMHNFYVYISVLLRQAAHIEDLGPHILLREFNKAKLLL